MVRDNNEYNKNLNLDDLRKEKINEIIVKFTDHNGNFDYENFKNYIEENGEKVIREGYGLNFLGKRAAELLAGQESTTVFVPDIEHNEKEENKNTENIYISADNLEALRHLKHSYYKKIKCIYIDPPYNTGSDGFCYPDNFKYDKEILSEKLGVSIDEAERILSMESNRTNSHSSWLSFMYARLLIARELLTDDGAIFISIDDNEMANLKLLCDNVFGEENNIANFIINKTAQGANQSDTFKVTHEYLLLYTKNYKTVINSDVEQENNKKYKYKDEKGNYAITNSFDSINSPLSANKNRGYTVYYNEEKKDAVIKDEYDKENNKFLDYDKKLIKNGYIPIRPGIRKGVQYPWNWSAKRFKEEYKTELVFKENKNGELNIYHKNRDTGLVKDITIKNFDTRKAGNDVLNSLMGRKVFDYPKSIDMIKWVLSKNDDRECIVLDFFSGSGTTPHATMEYNAENESKIKIIAVQLPENLEELLKNSSDNNSREIIKNQITLCDECGYPHTLDYIGIERIKRAAAKIKEETGADIDYGFKHFTLVDRKETLSKLEKFNPGMPLLTQDEILNEYSVESRIITMLCEDGYGLTPKYEVLDLDGYKAYYIDKRLYLVEKDFDSKNIMALLKLMEKEDLVINKVVIFGYAFSTKELQQLKDNAEKIGIDDDKDIIIKY